MLVPTFIRNILPTFLRSLPCKPTQYLLIYCYCAAVCDEGPSVFAQLLTVFSCLLIAATLPLSLFFVVKVVQVSTQ